MVGTGIAGRRGSSRRNSHRVNGSARIAICKVAPCHA